MRKTFQFTFLSFLGLRVLLGECEEVRATKEKKSRMESNCDEENKVALNSRRRRRGSHIYKKEEMTEIHSLPVHDL